MGEEGSFKPDSGPKPDTQEKVTEKALLDIMISYPVRGNAGAENDENNKWTTHIWMAT